MEDGYRLKESWQSYMRRAADADGCYWNELRLKALEGEIVGAGDFYEKSFMRDHALMMIEECRRLRKEITDGGR